MSTIVQPHQLTLDRQGRLVIDWSDGSRRVYEIAQLRDRCPCATCLAEQTTGQSAPSHADVAIQQMLPVGNYAYKILFSDGHDTGIYPLELLRQLGE
jgi:DUF971 family protein